jgi:peptidoglycan-associated lipoprotein
MATRWLGAVGVSAILFASACASKRAAAPPPPPAARENVIALLPEPDGQSSGIIVSNQAGVQNLTQPNQAVRVARADVPPGTPFILNQTDVRRLFGAAIDVLPEPEVVFILHFDEGRDVLNAESLVQLPAILKAIRDRSSTAITVTGHTDTVADPQFNYELGMRRARGVADILRARGVNASDLFVSSHGDADLLVKTARRSPNDQNRRVEVIVR